MFELVQKRLAGAGEQELWDQERTLTAEAGQIGRLQSAGELVRELSGWD